MQLCLTLEHRFFQTPDNKIWTVTQCPYDFYREYLEVFDSVRVISRAFPVPEAKDNFLPVEGPGVSFYTMPGYRGPFGYLKQFSQVREKAKNAVPAGSAVILRLPGQVGNSIESSLTARHAPFAVEVVADPWDVLSPAANRHIVAPLARRYFTRKLQQQCKRAVAVSYVTQQYLQKRYPPLSEHQGIESKSHGIRGQAIKQYATAVSDANLSPQAFVSQPREALREAGSLRIIFVGTLESLYKGPDVLIDAVGVCKMQGVKAKIRFIGIGRQIDDLKKRCAALGIADQVEFVGSVSAGAGVRSELDQADLFVLPSRAEGVPRAMLEAMARGLPCLGTAIGGIPELLDPEDLVAEDDVQGLAALMCKVSRDTERRRRMSLRNLEKSRGYSAEVLARRRQLFFQALKERTSHFDLPGKQDAPLEFASSIHGS